MVALGASDEHLLTTTGYDVTTSRVTTMTLTTTILTTTPKTTSTTHTEWYLY